MKSSFLGEVDMYKKKALKKLVDEHFRALPKNLQTSFLDVALFIVPLSLYLHSGIATKDEVYLRLSAIQDRQPEYIKADMDELQRRGFLDWTSTVSVHEFYLEFAASIEESSIYNWISESTGVLRTKEPRTVVLKLDEREENYVFSWEFTTVKAVVLRSCKSLTVLCGIENLASLASLDLHSCPSLKWIQLPAVGWKMHNLRWFTWQNMEDDARDDAKSPQQQNLKALSIVNKFQELLSRMTRGRRMRMDGLLLQAKGLEVLRLANTGISYSVDLNGCLPQLRELEVCERNLEGLRVCNLPNLESFFYSADASDYARAIWGNRFLHSYEVWLLGQMHSVPRKGVLTQRGLLEGCPKLQDVFIGCSSVKDDPQGILVASPNLRELYVNRLWNVSRAPDLTAAAESLETLSLRDCQELTTLNFGCTYRNLRNLCLSKCPNVTEVTGLARLPGLHVLHIENCAGLEKVIGLGGLVSLKVFEIRVCPKLHFHSWLRDSGNLTEVEKIAYDGPISMDELFDLGGWTKLRTLLLTSSDNSFTEGMLKFPNSLQELWLGEAPRDVLSVENNGQIFVIPGHATTLGGLAELSQLALCSISSLDRLSNLTNLEVLHLVNLRSLRGLQGIESLRNLERLYMLRCSSVEVLPSLSALVKLSHLICFDCTKLSSVEGCGGLPSLERVAFSGCKSLARFPLWNRKDWKGIQCLQIARSKFASVEAAMAWAEDEQTTPKVLRIAAVDALRCEFLDWINNNNNRGNACELILDRLLPKMAKIRNTEKENHDIYRHYYKAVSEHWNGYCWRVSDKVPNLFNDHVLERNVAFLPHAFKGQPVAHHWSRRCVQGLQLVCQPTTSMMQAEPSIEFLRRFEEAGWFAKVTNRHFIDQCCKTPDLSAHVVYLIFVAYLFYCVPSFNPYWVAGSL